jgi:fatty-acid desaturase
MGNFAANRSGLARYLVGELSDSHLGSRRFVTRDGSTNNWFVALLTFGEGLHNNHYAHPMSDRHGLKWYEINMNWYGIWMLKMFGLATQNKRAGAADLVRREILADGNLTPTGARHLQSAAGG